MFALDFMPFSEDILLILNIKTTRYKTLKYNSAYEAGAVEYAICISVEE